MEPVTHTSQDVGTLRPSPEREQQHAQERKPEQNKGIKVRATRRGTYPNSVVHERGDVFVIKEESDFSPNWMAPVNPDTEILAQPAPGVRKGERLLHSGPMATRPTPGRLGPEDGDIISPKDHIKKSREQGGAYGLQPGEIANETTPNAQSPDTLPVPDVGMTEALEAQRGDESDEQRKQREEADRKRTEALHEAQAEQSKRANETHKGNP